MEALLLLRVHSWCKALNKEKNAGFCSEFARAKIVLVHERCSLRVMGPCQNSVLENDKCMYSADQLNFLSN